MNSHFRLPSSDSPIKLEHAFLNFEINQEMINKPLYVFFRALNFSSEEKTISKEEGCLSLFIEAEFRSVASAGKYIICKDDSELLPNK